MANVNFDNVEAWTGATFLGAGRHLIKVIEAEEKPASTGTPQFILKLVAIAGDEVGGTIIDYVAVTQNTMGKVLQVVRAFGIQVPQGNFNLEASAFLNRQAWITVREEPGRKDPSKMYGVVKAYEAAGAGASADPSDPLAGAGFGAQQPPVAVGAGAVPPVGIPANGAPALGDDDIPF